MTPPGNQPSVHTPLTELNGALQPSRARHPARHLRDRGGLAAVPNALNSLAAVWLLLSATSFDHAGAWLTAAPLLLDHETSAVAVNDFVVGLVVIALAVVSMAISWRARSRPRFGAHPGDSSRMR